MDPVRWRRIEGLYHAAAARPPGERTAFLAEACAGDEGLRQEVEALLATPPTADGILAAPALAAAVTLVSDSTAVLTGQRIGVYQLRERIGAGGMGEVYRARDTRLGRDVAIKILPRAFTDDADRLARFEREARVLAALNHPNICTVYDVGEAGGLTYIAMEVVEGEPLSARLSGRPLPSDEVVRIGLQLADAVAHAHDRGVVHRDLKGANVMVTPEGRVKVLDFGLAKRVRADALDAAATGSTTYVTAPQAMLGTLPYMSPEQLRGLGADARSDVWALGVMLYEMAAGSRPFDGQTAFELSSAILHEAPPPLARAPAALQAVIDRCLEKEPARRYQRAGEVRAALETLGIDRRPASARRPVTAVLAIAALVIAAIVAAGRYWFAAPAPTNSVAILPFVNVSGDPDLEYLSDGITESLINALAQMPNLAVMSRNSVFRYKGREADAQAAGRTLNVEAVITGRVLQRGDALSISAELIDVRDNRQLWGEQYNRRLADILTVQEEVSADISERLRGRLTGDERKQLTRRYTQNTEAYQLYLRALYHWNRRNADGFNRSIEYFQKAIAADPNYAPAHAGLAQVYANLANYNFALIPPREAWASAEAAGRRALQIDETLAAGHAALALVAYQWGWDWAAADQAFRRALELDPASASTHHWYAHFLMTMGRPQEAQRIASRALQLDPLDLPINAHQGWHHLWLRQYDQAIAPLEMTLELAPMFTVARWYLGLAYEQQGAFEQAIAQFEDVVRLTDGHPSMVALLGHAYAGADRRAEARAILGQLAAQAKQRYVPSYPVAVIHAALGEHDEAFARLERAYEERDSWMDYLALDPRLDVLRTDAHFATLLRRMNLNPHPPQP